MHRVEKERIPFIDLDGLTVGHLELFGDGINIVILSDEEAEQYGEEKLQIIEDMSYDYRLVGVTSDWELADNQMIRPSRIDSKTGRIQSRSHTGLLVLELKRVNRDEKAFAKIEVQSSKLNYRDEYQRMLEDIAEKTTDLLMNVYSPSQTRLLPDPGKDAQTVQQRFEFLKSLIYTRQFREALQRIINTPHRLLQEREEIQDIRRGGKLGSKGLRQIAKGGQKRLHIPAEHPLHDHMRNSGIENPSIPAQIVRAQKQDTVDTAENRFVKHTLTLFTSFLAKMRSSFEPTNAPQQRLFSQLEHLQQYLDGFLRHSFFRDISDPQILPLGSPVLQKRVGYREVLHAWLKFSLAASLSWSGGDDVYGAGNRDVATLYEYWVFFTLLDILQSIFEIPPSEIRELIAVQKDGFGVKLKAGQHLRIRGQYVRGKRRLNMAFHFNRTFSQSTEYSESGTWTRSMRPDYTLSVWPAEFSNDEVEAERQELLAHIHFDAKYKLASVMDAFGSSDSSDIDAISTSEKHGTYKRGDLLKMHAYHDAIRRSEGAYILYPGTSNGEIFSVYQELLPSVGAFCLRPQTTGQHVGVHELETLIDDVVQHMCHRLSIRERLGYYRYKIQNDARQAVDSALPEHKYSSSERALLLSEHFVLVVPIRTLENWAAIQQAAKCAIRLGNNGSISPDIISARHILFCVGEPGTAVTGLFWVEDSPVVQPASQIDPHILVVDSSYSDVVITFRFSRDESFDEFSWDLDDYFFSQPVILTMEDLARLEVE